MMTTDWAVSDAYQGRRLAAKKDKGLASLRCAILILTTKRFLRKSMEVMMQKFPDLFTLYARVFPAIITILPLPVMMYFLLTDAEFKDLVSFLSGLRVYGIVSLSVVVLYLLAQVIRVTSKYFESKYFTKAQGFPTAYFMLYSDDTYGSEFKSSLRQLVYDKLNIALPTAEEEQQDRQAALRRLKDVTKQIVFKVRDEPLVKNYNMNYAFFRNLIGGTIYAMLFCTVNIVLSFTAVRSNVLLIVSAVLMVVYIILFFFRKKILFSSSEAYAKQILEEFAAAADD